MMKLRIRAVYDARSVAGWTLDAIDDQRLHGCAPGFQPEAELLLQGCKERRRIARSTAGRITARIVVESELVVPHEAGAVDDNPAGAASKIAGERVHGDAAGEKHAPFALDAA